ncbi:MAG: hypothetical protein ACK4UP_02110 [Spirosomataceae bacterium]
MSHDSTTPSVPTWLLLLVYVLILVTLFTLGDFFTFVVGFLVTTLVFASGYNRDNLHHD